MATANPIGVFFIRKIQGKALQQLYCCLELTNDDIGVWLSASIMWIYKINYVCMQRE
jgi:hypothetical protein